MPKFGLGRMLVVADTDAEALRLAERAYPVWHASFVHLFKVYDRMPSHPRPAEFSAIMADGRGFCGSPATVTEIIRKQMAEAGADYFVGFSVPLNVCGAPRMFAHTLSWWGGGAWGPGGGGGGGGRPAPPGGARPLRPAHPIRYIKAIGPPRVNDRLTRFRHPGTADNEDFGQCRRAVSFARSLRGPFRPGRMLP